MPPKEYIFKLFEKSDIVVLGERDHRDTVQYDLIQDILADPRFAEQIGYVYTEVGSYNMNDDVNRLLQGQLSDGGGLHGQPICLLQEVGDLLSDLGKIQPGEVLERYI